jgi:hypothetical protein
MTTEHPNDDAQADLDLPQALLDALASLDPAATDAPPIPGSPRHLSILEHAMTTTDPTTAVEADAPSADQPNPIRLGPPHRRRRLALLLAAAALVAVIVGLAIVMPGSDPAPASASVALAQAADTTGDAITLRVAATYERSGSTDEITVAGNGSDYRIEAVGTFDDGRVERETTVVIGDTVWEDGAMRTDVPPEERNAAFAPSSAAVVDAILDGSMLEDLGDSDVRGESARHIRATLTPTSRAALAALSPSQVAMFELEYPDDVETVDLWVADDLIRRIRVEVDWGTGEGGEPQSNLATIEFYDFGADIEITPPT